MTPPTGATSGAKPALRLVSSLVDCDSEGGSSAGFADESFIAGHELSDAVVGEPTRGDPAASPSLHVVGGTGEQKIRAAEPQRDEAARGVPSRKEGPSASAPVSERLKAKLVARAVPEDLAETMLRRVAGSEAEDPFLLACSQSRQLFDARGLVGQALVDKLLSKGVSVDLAERASAIFGREEVEDRALDLAEETLRGSRATGLENRKRRAMSYLQRRGYSAGAAAVAIRKGLASELGDEFDPLEE